MLKFAIFFLTVSYYNVLNCMFFFMCFFFSERTIYPEIILWTWKIRICFIRFLFTSVATHDAFLWMVALHRMLPVLLIDLLDVLDENDKIPRRENCFAKRMWIDVLCSLSDRIYWNMKHSNGTSNKYVSHSICTAIISSSSLFVRLTIPNAQMNNMSRHYHHQSVYRKIREGKN